MDKESNTTKKVYRRRNKEHVLTDEERQEAHIDKLGRTRRSIWFILRTVIILAVISILCYAVFMEAMYISNNYIIITEGMALRADCILNDGDISLLSDYFSDSELNVDTALFADQYDAFHVESYNYSIDVEKFSVYPWSKKVTFIVRETVTQIIASPYDDSNTQPVPQWTNARYEVRAEKFDGKWIITKLTILETNPEVDPPHTPDYSKLDQTN